MSFQSFATMSVPSGVNGDGFATTVSPTSNAVKIFSARMSTGAFHGAMAATTPTGVRTTFTVRSSVSSRMSTGRAWSAMCLPKTVEYHASPPAPAWPFSADATSSMAWKPPSIAAHICRMTSRRSSSGVAAHFGPAAAAAAMASSTIATVAAGHSRDDLAGGRVLDGERVTVGDDLAVDQLAEAVDRFLDAHGVSLSCARDGARPPNGCVANAIGCRAFSAPARRQGAAITRHTGNGGTTCRISQARWPSSPAVAVSGASGAPTGTLLAENGVKVVLADLNKEALDKTVEELTGKGHDVIGVPTDVADLSSMQNLANQAFDHYGKVDIAFLNAGIGGGGNLFDDEMDSWNRVIAVNFLGVLHGIKAFVPRMIAQGTHGHVLATSSGAGTTGTMYTGAGYATTKAAVCSLMECLYGQLRDQGADIQATVVFPPLARTNLAGDPAIMDMVGEGPRGGRRARRARRARGGRAGRVRSDPARQLLGAPHPRAGRPPVQRQVHDAHRLGGRASSTPAPRR